MNSTEEVARDTLADFKSESTVSACSSVRLLLDAALEHFNGYL